MYVVGLKGHTEIVNIIWLPLYYYYSIYVCTYVQYAKYRLEVL